MVFWGFDRRVKYLTTVSLRVEDDIFKINHTKFCSSYKHANPTEEENMVADHQ